MDSKTQNIWDKARMCNCGLDDCHPNNHRLCYICGERMNYGAHESNIFQRNSSCAWNVDHVRPSSKNGSNKQCNLAAVHIICNRRKGNN